MVIITGTKGYIAQNLFSRLYEKHVDAALLDMRGDEWRTARFAEGDCVVHLAGAVHGGARGAEVFHEVNAALTAALARNAEAGGARFIFVSTMAVFGAKDLFGAVNEIAADAVPAPKTPYGASKLAGERAVMEVYGGKACIVRPPMVYGENCTGNYRFLRGLTLKLKAVPKIENRRSMIYIHNLCEFLFLLIKNGDTGVFHPQDGETVTTYKMAAEIGRLNGVCVRTPRLPFMGAAAKLAPPFAKAFGSLSYPFEMSEYAGGDYRAYGAAEALERTERLWRENG